MHSIGEFKVTTAEQARTVLMVAMLAKDMGLADQAYEVLQLLSLNASAAGGECAK